MSYNMSRVCVTKSDMKACVCRAAGYVVITVSVLLLLNSGPGFAGAFFVGPGDFVTLLIIRSRLK